MAHEGSRKGFTLIEMAVVMIVLGSLIAISFPYLKTFTLDTQRHASKNDLTSALDALLGYTFANGAFPDWPDDGGGADIVNQLPTAKLGLASNSGYGDIIYYDVNDALQFADEVDEAAGQSQAAFCTAVLAEIAKVETATTADDPEPRMCNTIASCAPATIADQTSVGIVLVSRGRNKALDENNGDGDRVYEHGDRGGDDVYDDVMKVMTLYEVSNYYGCSGSAGGPWGTPWAGGGGLACGANMPISIYNNTSVDLFVQQSNEVCWAVTAGNYIAFCNTLGFRGRGSIGNIDVSTSSDCSGAFYSDGPTAASDTSGDGEILYTCTEGPYACTVD